MKKYTKCALLNEFVTFVNLWLCGMWFVELTVL